VLPLDPRVQEFQEAYVRKVADTLHDLPNVLWEVANESSGGGTAGTAFAEVLGQAGTPEWGDSTGLRAAASRDHQPVMPWPGSPRVGVPHDRRLDRAETRSHTA
jgi:hypothetical protein